MMKKIVVVLISLICLNFVSLNVFANITGTSIFNDNAKLYSTEDRKHLEKLQNDIINETGWNVAIITSNESFNSINEAGEFCKEYYISTFGDATSGVVYLIDLEVRYIFAHNDASKYLPNRRINKILEKTEDRYFDFDDVGNLEVFYSEIKYYYYSGTPNFAERIGWGQLIFACIIGGIALLITLYVIWYAYRVHSEPTTKNYLNTDTFDLYMKKDTFVREYTTRTRINNDSSSSSGSSSSSSGSGSSGSR